MNRRGKILGNDGSKCKGLESRIQAVYESISLSLHVS